MHRNNLQLCFHLIRNIVQILNIFIRYEDLFDSGTHRSHQLFRQTADGQDKSAQRHFAGHGEFRIDCLTGYQRGKSRRQCDARGRPVLWNCSFRNVNMKIILFEQLRLLRKFRFHQRNCYLNRFLHNIAQLAGDDRFSRSFRHHGFDEQDFTPCTGPGQAGHNARIFLFKHMIVPDWMHIQKFPQFLRRNRDGFLVTAHQLYRCHTAKRIHLLFQPAHAGLHGIIGNDRADGIIAYLQLALFDSGVLHCLRYQMAFRDLELFTGCIPRKFNDFHTI